MSYIVFSIGRSNIKIAVATDIDTLDVIENIPTPTDAELGIKKIIKIADELRGQKEPPSGIVGAVRGQLDESKSCIKHDKFLKGWLDYPIVETLEKYWGCHVFLENDSALTGLGEAVYGAGKDFSLIVYHTISSGVGGVKVEYGWIDDASTGFEPGHQIIDIDRTVLGTNITPTLENLVSGVAVEERTGIKPQDISQNDVIWDNLAEYLGQGLRNTILYWSPEVVVLGGQMILGEPRIPIESIRNHTVDALDGFMDCPYITTATLGDTGILRGALHYLGQQEILSLENSDDT